MAFYADRTYGAPSAIAGLTASVFLVGGVLGRVVTSRYSDRLSLKTLAIGSLSVQLAMVLLYFVDAGGIALLIAVRLIHGLAFGVANTVLPAMAVNALPPQRLGEGTGYFMLSNSLGVGIGPMMSVLVVIGIDYEVLFVICAALSIVALALMLPVRDSGRIAEARGRESLLESIIDRSTFGFSFFMFLVAFAYSSINAFINTYAIGKDLGFFVPFVFLVYSVTLIITRPITGRLMDRYGENVVLYPSIASMGAGLLLAAAANRPLTLLACGIFMGTGFGTCMSVGQAVATRITASTSSSKPISTFFLLCDGGCGIGPFMLGFVVSGFGYEAMYVICAFVAFGAVIYYHIVHGRSSQAHQDAPSSEKGGSTPGL